MDYPCGSDVIPHKGPHKSPIRGCVERRKERERLKYATSGFEAGEVVLSHGKTYFCLQPP